MNRLKIGEVARRANVNLQTIRYYERRRLLAEPPRSAGNYRLYTPETVQRVRFIKRAQELGFTLEEIQELLSLRAAPKVQCAKVRARAEAKAADIEKRIRGLRAMQQSLIALIKECEDSGPVSKCPILDALDIEEVQYAKARVDL